MIAVFVLHMRADGIAGYSHFCHCAPFVNTNWLSRYWWVGKPCLYNAKFRVRVLAVSYFRDRCEDTGLDDGPSFFLIWSYFYWAILCDARSQSERLSCYSRPVCVVQMMGYNLCQWIAACIVIMYVWSTTRVRDVVNIFLYEGFSLLSF